MGLNEIVTGILRCGERMFAVAVPALCGEREIKPTISILVTWFRCVLFSLVHSIGSLFNISNMKNLNIQPKIPFVHITFIYDVRGMSYIIYLGVFNWMWNKYIFGAFELGTLLSASTPNSKFMFSPVVIKCTAAVQSIRHRMEICVAGWRKRKETIGASTHVAVAVALKIWFVRIADVIDSNHNSMLLYGFPSHFICILCIESIQTFDRVWMMHCIARIRTLGIRNFRLLNTNLSLI